MGKGSGLQMNKQNVLRIVELILLIAALACFMISTSKSNESILVDFHHYMESHDAMNISAGIYVIILGIMIMLQLIKNLELDKKFVGVVSSIGAVLLIATGIAVCVDYNHGSSNRGLTSGILGICGGITLVIEALKDFEVF